MGDMASIRKEVTLTFEASDRELENILRLVEETPVGFTSETTDSLRKAINAITSQSDWDEGEPEWLKRKHAEENQ